MTAEMGHDDTARYRCFDPTLLAPWYADRKHHPNTNETDSPVTSVSLRTSAAKFSKHVFPKAPGCIEGVTCNVNSNNRVYLVCRRGLLLTSMRGGDKRVSENPESRPVGPTPFSGYIRRKSSMQGETCWRAACWLPSSYYLGPLHTDVWSKSWLLRCSRPRGLNFVTGSSTTASA